MSWFAIGPVASGLLTARQIQRAGQSSDLAVPSGEHWVNVTSAVGSTPQAFVGRRFATSNGAVQAAEDTTTADRRERLYRAAQTGFAGILPHWRRLEGDDQASEATFRWIVHTVAGADLIVGGAFTAGGSTLVRTSEQIEALVSHVENIMSADGVHTWYNFMLSMATQRAQYFGTAFAAGSTIYTDAIEPSTGAPRDVDGSWTSLNNAIPAGFNTESRTLR